jgi:phosphatidylserine decarboxylase precursor
MTKPWLLCLDKLKVILDIRKDLRTALDTAIATAAFPGINDIPAYYRFLENMLTHIPTQREMETSTIQFHYIVNCSPGDLLQKDEIFQQWLAAFAKDHGSFLDTTESAKQLDSFTGNPQYRIEEYDPGPSGWLTFNQFFARKVKPGKRPVAAPCDDSVIVSPADSTYLGCWPIDDQAKVTAKGASYPIAELLDGSPYQGRFTAGVFTHSYLDTTDYHRYHVPIGGTIKEARTIPGRVLVDMEKDQEGKLTVKDDIGFQFRQTRGIVILESPLGYVALVPVGMGHVSSVNLTAEAGSTLVKGEEFGYFCYGGSDMILLFEQGKVEFTARPNVHYKQGEEIAQAVRK